MLFWRSDEKQLRRRVGAKKTWKTLRGAEAATENQEADPRRDGHLSNTKTVIIRLSLQIHKSDSFEDDVRPSADSRFLEMIVWDGYKSLRVRVALQ